MTLLDELITERVERELPQEIDDVIRANLMMRGSNQTYQTKNGVLWQCSAELTSDLERLTDERLRKQLLKIREGIDVMLGLRPQLPEPQ